MLMKEHRLIAPVIKGAAIKLETFRAEGHVDSRYVAGLVDFLQTYADRCHHGKEEDILMRALGNKDLDGTLRRLREELVQEHAWSRRTTMRLAEANQAHSSGEMGRLDDVLSALRRLVAFYPGHLTKEESRFFRPSMTFLSADEQESIVQRFAAHDQSMIHQKYQRVVEQLNQGLDP
jgi:hemerythrin-like domain-containing protein